MKNYFKKGVNLIRRTMARHEYHRLFDQNYINKTTNIFDYNWIIQQRRTPFRELHTANEMYGIGYQFRRATGYNGKIKFLVEHSINSVRTDNVIEYLNNDFPIVFTPSRGRFEVIQPLTNKLVIPYGPNTMPYAKAVCDEPMIAALKQNLGRTLVVYPQHNTADFSYFEAQNLIKDFIAYVENFRAEHHFDTILCCMYFRDIMGGAHVEFEKKGWKIISCGHHQNYDFGDCSKTVYRIADFVIAQESYATNIQATYMGVPSISVAGNRQIKRENGVIEDRRETMGDGVICKQCDSLFGAYHEEITPEQLEWCTKWGGFDCVKTPQEIRLFMDYAKDVWHCDMSDRAFLKVANKKKYEPIRKYILESLDKRKKA